jgi:hypothetical protein
MVISAGLVTPDFAAGAAPAAGPMTLAEASRRLREAEHLTPPSAA